MQAKIASEVKKTPNLTIQIQYGDCDKDESPLKEDSFLHKVSMNYGLLVLLQEFYKLIILQELSLVYDWTFKVSSLCLPL